MFVGGSHPHSEACEPLHGGLAWVRSRDGDIDWRGGLVQEDLNQLGFLTLSLYF
jgi:hypothetical protein